MRLLNRNDFSFNLNDRLTFTDSLMSFIKISGHTIKRPTFVLEDFLYSSEECTVLCATLWPIDKPNNIELWMNSNNTFHTDYEDNKFFLVNYKSKVFKKVNDDSK